MVNKEFEGSVWLSITLLTILLFVAFLTLTNWYFDHYQIFNSSLATKSAVNSNQRFNKIEHLNNHVGSYNAFVLGSSRIGHFPVDHLNKVSGKRYYNLNFFSGIPSDYLLALKHLKRTGHTIEEVIIGFDLYPLFSPPDIDKPNFKHHPDVIGKNRFEYLVDYLFQASFFYLFTEYQYYFGEMPEIYRHDYQTGEYIPVRMLETLEQNPGEFWAGEIESAKRKKERFQQTQHELNKQQVRDIEALVKWLDEQKIKYKLFIQPSHPFLETFYTEDERALLPDLLSELTTTNFHVISLDSSLKNDNANYYDLMHYRKNVGKVLIDALYR
jgi:hypothetical protein